MTRVYRLRRLLHGMTLQPAESPGSFICTDWTHGKQADIISRDSPNLKRPVRTCVQPGLKCGKTPSMLLANAPNWRLAMPRHAQKATLSPRSKARNIHARN